MQQRACTAPIAKSYSTRFLCHTILKDAPSSPAGNAQEFLDWASATTRIWRGAEDLEVEWTAGPLPFKDGRGRELTLRYETTLDSGAALLDQQA